MTPAVTAVAVVAAVGTAAAGSYIYWNTRVLNADLSASGRETAQPSTTRRPTGSSRRCRSRGSPRSRWRSISIRRARSFVSRGRYVLVNRSATPIETVHVGSTTMFPSTRSSSPNPLSSTRSGASIISFSVLSAPLAPGEARTLTFAVSKHRKGFKSQVGRLVGAVQRNFRAQRRAGAVDRRVVGAVSAGREGAQGARPGAVRRDQARREDPAQPRPLGRRFRLHPFRHHAVDQRRPDRARAGLCRARMERRWPALFPLRDGHADPEFLVGAVGALRGGPRQME